MALILAFAFRLGLPDEVLGSVYGAACALFETVNYVSFCSFSPDSGGYVEVDAAFFVPEVISKEGKKLIEDSHGMFLAPVFDDGEVPADDMLVQQLLEVGEKLDGCIVIGPNDEPVVTVDEARSIRLDARRINPYEGIIWPNPSHDD